MLISKEKDMGSNNIQMPQIDHGIIAVMISQSCIHTVGNVEH